MKVDGGIGAMLNAGSGSLQTIADAAKAQKLTMERGHRDDVLELSPQKLRRTFTLREAAILIMEYGAHQLADLATLRAHLGDKEPIDVPDPIGQDLTVFAQVGDRIASLIPPVLELCCRSSAANG